METRGGKGKRANWSSLYQSDRPRDILQLTEAQEATVKQFIGFGGKDQDGNERKLFIIVSDATSQPTLTDFANTPIGTIIFTPKIASILGYQHQAQSSPAVIGDWAKIAKTTVT